jgi:DNA-binding CsgD family transcriptional regulator
MKTRGRPPHPDILTPREFEVLELLREGLTNPEIAERMGISLDGAKYHVSEIMSKLGVGSRQEAALISTATHRPWWANAAIAPVAWLWGKARAVAQSPSALATGAAGVVFGATMAGLVFMAYLIVMGHGDGIKSGRAGPRAAPTLDSAAEVTMNEVGGSGANGTATLAGMQEGGGILTTATAYFPAGLAPGGHPWAILPGTCATRPFTTLGAGTGGYDTSSDGTELSGYISSTGQLEAVRDGFHYIAVYDVSASGNVVVVSCGDIPAVSPADGTTTTERADLVRLTISQRSGSGVTGDVLLWTRHDGVGVAAMTNAPGWHAFHIHSGSCAAPGPVESFLAGIDPFAPTTVAGIDRLLGATEPTTIQDGNHHLDVHAEATGGAVVSCVDIPAGPMADGATPPRRASFVRLSLHEQGGSGVVGNVVLWESRSCCRSGNDLNLAADIVAGPDPGPLTIDVHEGSCPALGAFDVDSAPVSLPVELWGDWEPPAWFDSSDRAGVDAGNPSFQGTSPIALAALQDRDHYIQVRARVRYVPDALGNPQPQGGVVVACADIPEV